MWRCAECELKDLKADTMRYPYARYLLTASACLLMIVAAATMSLNAWAHPATSGLSLARGRTHKGTSPTPTGTTSPGATPQPSPSASPSSSPTTAPSPTTTPAPTPTQPPAPSGWTTVLDDEFSSSGIPSHWQLYNAPYGSGPRNCAAPSQDSAPGDGYMYLTMAYHSSGDCGAGWYTGGMMISDSYNLAEQAITVRWRVIPSQHPSAVFSHLIIPMAFPDDASYQWYQAEADFCEGDAPGGCTTFLHDGTSSDQGQQVYNHYPTINLTQWHTWRFEQANGTLTVYIDNMTTPFWVFKGTLSQFPNAHRRVVLQQECQSDGCPSSTYAGDAEKIQIDWITIQKPG